MSYTTPEIPSLHTDAHDLQPVEPNMESWLSESVVDITAGFRSFNSAQDFGKQYFNLFMMEGVSRMPIIGVRIGEQSHVFMLVNGGDDRQEHIVLWEKLLSAYPDQRIVPEFTTSLEGVSMSGNHKSDYAQIIFGDNEGNFSGKKITIDIGERSDYSSPVSLGLDGETMRFPPFTEAGRQQLREIFAGLSGEGFAVNIQNY